MPEGTIVYIATRLFDYAEKLKAESLERAVLKGIDAARNASIQHAHALSTFVPFRDTAQDTLRGPNPARVIYEADVARLKSLFAIVGYFDGVSKDEGICMEIGYAYALSRPVLLIATDFLIYKLKQNPSIRFYHDPIIERMTGRLVRNSTLPQAESFEQRLLTGISSLHEQISSEIVHLISFPNKYISPPPAPILKPSQRPVIFLDFGGGLFEWQKILAFRIHDLLKRKLNCDIIISQRYLDDSTSAYKAGEKDIALALMADVLIICSDSEEMNAGSAALVGFGRANKLPPTLSVVFAIGKTPDNVLRLAE